MQSSTPPPTGLLALDQPLGRAWALARRWRNDFPFNAGRVRGQLERGGPGGAPVCVMGMLRGTLGLGRGARLFRQALESGGIETSGWDVSARYAANQDLPLVAGDVRRARTVVAHINPVEHVHAIWTATGPRPGRGFRVGYWAWETPIVPASWEQGLDAVDEIWCPSHFTAHAVEALARGRRPVRVVPHPVGLAHGRRDRARFGLPEEAVVVLAASDILSSTARKNPEGALKAFDQSRIGRNGQAVLVLKLSGGEANVHALSDLTRAASGVPGARIMVDRLDEQGMSDLIASADIVLSPHRSEGFGLVPAEAMANGVAVIATGWSGNMDFMDSRCAALLDYRMIAIIDPQGNYPGGQWADPDLDQAAHWLRALCDDPDRRRALALAGQARVRALCGQAPWFSTVGGLLRL